METRTPATTSAPTQTTTGLDDTAKDTVAARLDEQEAELLPRIAALERTVAELVESGRETNIDDEHDPDGATIGFERAQAQALLDHARNDLDQVAEARRRLAEDPTFGTCMVCDGPIGVERLVARPATTTCVGCAR